MEHASDTLISDTLRSFGDYSVHFSLNWPVNLPRELVANTSVSKLRLV